MPVSPEITCRTTDYERPAAGASQSRADRRLARPGRETGRKHGNRQGRPGSQQSVEVIRTSAFCNSFTVA